MCSADIFLGLLAILFPPLPVWVKCGICSADSIINILLLMLGYIPGLIHSWYIIAKYPEPAYDYDPIPSHEAGRGHSHHVHHHSSSGGGSHVHGSSNQRVHYVVVHQPHTDGASLAAAAAPDVTKPVAKSASSGGGGYGTTPINSAPAPAPSPSGPAQASSSSAPQPAAAALDDNAGEGTSADGGAPPPSYAQVVAGDNKIQSKD